MTLRTMLQFTKMHGAGNDYIYVDCFAQTAPADPAALARVMSDRHFGVGGDGLILIEPTQRGDARMRMFNADGSEAEMCGNGVRCVAKYVVEHGISQNNPLRVKTGAGVLSLEWHATGNPPRVQTVRVDMGPPILQPERVPTTLPSNHPSGAVVSEPLTVGEVEVAVTCISMGNPHCVIFVDEDAHLPLPDELVLGVGPIIETSEWFPNRVNVEFVQVISRGEVWQRTWERGSGETLACGTGACAVCVAGVLTGRTDREITNHLLGGDLQLAYPADGGSVYMTGPAVEVFTGVWPPA